MLRFTPYERFNCRLAGEPVDRTPNFDIMMTFAAHYIGQPLSSYYQDPKVLAEANLAVQKTFDLDILQVISDPYREAADFGMEVHFPYDGLPVAREPLLADLQDLQRLKSPDPGTGRRMSDRLEAIRYLRERLGGQVPIMGWVEGALAQAADLRGMLNLMKDLTLRPEWIVDLLEQVVRVEIAFAQAQIEAGADIIDIDWMVDINQAADVFGDQTALCGNIDPVGVMLQSTAKEVSTAVLVCQEKGGSKYFSAAGCEIPDRTPEQNLRAQTDALRLSGGG